MSERINQAQFRHTPTTQSSIPHDLKTEVSEQHMSASAVAAPTANNLTQPVIRRLQQTQGNHFVQRLVEGFTDPIIRRDLATPPPANAPAPQANLSRQQIQVAIVHNNAHFNQTHVSTIQGIIGAPPTGRFNRQDILLIAQLQEEYGLLKDGLIGPELFRFLNTEINLEGLDDTEENNLISFELNGPDTPRVSSVINPSGGIDVEIQGRFNILARLPQRGRASEYQYRQFIRGTAVWTEASGTVHNIARLFSTVPGGRLPATFREDGNTRLGRITGNRAANARSRSGSSSDEDQYVDENGTVDQANGGTYRLQDFPRLQVNVGSGDTVELRIFFRGEIQRNNRAVFTRHWTAIDELVSV